MRVDLDEISGGAPSRRGTAARRLAVPVGATPRHAHPTWPRDDETMTVDDAFRAYAAERLTGLMWVPAGETFVPGRTILRMRDHHIEVVDSDERGAELRGSSVLFAEESLALASAIARRRMAAPHGATIRQTEQFLDASSARALPTTGIREVLEAPVLVPSLEGALFEPVVSDSVAVVATGWQGLEAAGLASAPRTVLPLGALLLIPTVSSIVVHTRHDRIEMGSPLVMALRAQLSAQGGLFATGPAYVGGGGSVSDRVAAMRDVTDGTDLDWFPSPSVTPRTDRAGIARRGDEWSVWAATRPGSSGTPQTCGSEREALARLLQLMKMAEGGGAWR